MEDEVWELRVLTGTTLITYPPNNYRRNAYNSDMSPNTIGIYSEDVKQGKKFYSQYAQKPTTIVLGESITYTFDQLNHTYEVGTIDGKLLMNGEPHSGFVNLYRKKDQIWVSRTKSLKDGSFRFNDIPMHREYYIVAFNENEYLYPSISYDQLYPKAKVYETS